MRASDIAAGGWGLVLGRRGLLGLRLTACLFLLFGLGLRVRLGFGLFVRLAFLLDERGHAPVCLVESSANPVDPVGRRVVGQ